MDSVLQDPGIISCSLLKVLGSAVDLSEKGTIVCCLGDCGYYLKRNCGIISDFLFPLSNLFQQRIAGATTKSAQLRPATTVLFERGPKFPGPQANLVR